MSLLTSTASDILLVLASGYALHSIRYLQCRIGRGVGYKLYFRVLVIGLVWVGAWIVAPKLIFGGMVWAGWLDNTPSFIKNEDWTVYIFFVALFISLCCEWWLKRSFRRGLTDEYEFNLKLFQASGLVTETFLLRSLRQRKTVLVTLEGGKVYVGLVADFIPPVDEELKSFRLYPVASGRRDPGTQRLRFTTDYPLDEFYPVDEFGEKSGAEKKFDVVLLTNKISHIQSFDMEFYEAHFLKKPAPVAKDEGGAE